MATSAQHGKKHLITWKQLEEFAKASDREITHVFRVVKGERMSPPLELEFEKHFGFPLRDVAFAGLRLRRRRGAAA